MNATDIIFDADAFKADLLGSLENVMRDTMSEGASHVAGNAFETAPAKVLEFIRARKNKLADTADDIHAQIKSELEAGIKAGETQSQLAARVAKAFDDIGKGRALTIARTEAAAAYGAGQQDAMESSGIKMKRWVTSGLPNVRPAHREAGGQEVPVDEPFIVDDEELDYPGDENGSPENVINCRCVSVAVDPGMEEELSPFGL